MKPPLFGSDGRPFRLGTRLGKGGEGEVYALEGRNDQVLKYYTVKDLGAREPKIRKMISEKLATKSALIAFPIDIAFDKSGKFAGFTMPLIVAHQPLHELYSPGARKANFPHADYRFLILCAANIARAIGFAHANNCIVGDINHSGILISKDAKVRLIDADSFQISDGGRYYLCKVGVPEYTPPELQGQALGSTIRTANHDAFGLAIAVFQLLFMGRHPFSGRYAGGDIPLEKAVGEFRFAYSLKRAVGMTPPPGVPTLQDFPQAIADAFEIAFAPEGRNARPTARHWIRLLEELEKSLRTCAASPLHKYPVAASECPWCRMERRFFVPLFIPSIATADVGPLGAAVVGDVATIWRAIEAAKPPPIIPFPEYPGPELLPSPGIVKQKQNQEMRRLAGWAAIAGGIAFVFLYTQALLFGLALIGGGWLILSIKTKPTADLIKSFRNIQTKVYEVQDEWERQSNGLDYLEAKAKLQLKKASLEALPTEERQRLDEYNRNRRSAQLQQFLDGFQIRKHKISNIGPQKLINLLSYNIETAADVTESAILAVPGFGPKNSLPLLNWRRGLENVFQYNPAPNALDTAAHSKIRAEMASQAARLKSELSTGPAALHKLSATAVAKQQSALPFVQNLLKQRRQLIVDLTELGIALPNVPKPIPACRPTAPTIASSSSNSIGAAVRCPRCYSVMVIRTTTRGSNRGSKFYGCTKFPACKGTRPYP